MDISQNQIDHTTATIERRRFNLNRILIVAIYLSVFINSYVFFTSPFEFYFGYLIYIVLLPVFIGRYGFNKYLLQIFTVLLITGLINVLIGNNTAALFFKVYLGLLLSYFFYFYVIVEFRVNVELLFKWYMKGAYIVCVIGLVQFAAFKIGFRPGYDFTWILNKWGLAPGGTFGIRINSVFAEPTHLAAVISPAFFVGVYNFTRKKPLYIGFMQGGVIVLVYLLSFSGLGSVGVFLTMILLAVSFGLVRYVLVLIPMLVMLFGYLYDNVSEFRDRYSSIVDLISGGDFKLGKTHGSSYILYNNAHVAYENFKSNFIFGSGIGSHPVAFKKHSLAKDIKTFGFNLNSADANSMLLRLISETGLFGVLIFFFIIVKCYVARSDTSDTNHWVISNALLIMILLNLFRQGHYFLNGFPFFVLLYIYNKAQYLSYKYPETEPDVEAEQDIIPSR